MVSKKQKIDPELIDSLLKDQDSRKVFDQDGLLGELKKALAERMLDAEMDVHLDDDAEQAAAHALDEFEQGPWGEKYPAITASWRRRWAEIIPFFAFSAEVRKIIYTTNAIESLNSQVRRAVRNKGHFPSDQAATKLIYLALRQIVAKWKRPPKEWHAARAQFAIQFGERFTVEL